MNLKRGSESVESLQVAAIIPSEHRLSGTLKRHLTSLLLEPWLILLLVDALPRTSLLHQRLKTWMEPFLDLTGMWQRTWQLFAPEVDKIDLRVTAEISYADVTTRLWESRCGRSSLISGKWKTTTPSAETRTQPHGQAWRTTSPVPCRRQVARQLDRRRGNSPPLAPRPTFGNWIVLNRPRTVVREARRSAVCRLAVGVFLAPVLRVTLNPANELTSRFPSS